MRTESNILDGLSKLEIESIGNYVIKECMEIIMEEVEDFFDSKRQYIEVYLEGIADENITARALHERFYKVIYTPCELEKLFMRIERQINRALSRIQYGVSFDTHPVEMAKMVLKENTFAFLTEELRTLRLSRLAAKVLDTAWKKNCQCLAPKQMKKAASKVKMGHYVLSSVGVSPVQVRFSVNALISKRVVVLLEQNKATSIQLLKKMILFQVTETEKQWAVPGVVLNPSIA